MHGAAFAPAAELSNPFLQTSREGFRIALDVSAYSLIALTRAVAPLMEKRGGGSVLTLTYLGSQRVFTNYNVMGVAKAALEASVRYLASDLGPQNIRVNAISAGPIKTLAAAGISGFSSILQVYRERAPLRRNVELGGSRRRGGVPARPGVARHHRRDRHGRRRLPHQRRRVMSSPPRSLALSIPDPWSSLAGRRAVPRGSSASRRPAPRGRRRRPRSVAGIVQGPAALRARLAPSAAAYGAGRSNTASPAVRVSIVRREVDAAAFAAASASSSSSYANSSGVRTL